MTPTPQSSVSTPALAQNAFADQQQAVPTISASSSLRPSRNRPLADQHKRRLQATTAMSPAQQLEDATRLSPATLEQLRTLEHEYEASRLSGMDQSMPTTPKKGPSRRGTDIEFATEIGQGLLIEVRKLQMLLQQKDQLLKEVLERKADLERDADMMVKQLRQREEMQEQLKNQTWDLELAKQDLSGNVTQLQQSLNRSHMEQSRLTKQLNEVRAELDRMRDREEKLNATMETIKARHEHDMGVVRRHAAGLQREKLETKKQMDSLISELAIARAQSRMMARPENLPRISPSSSLKPTMSSSTTTTKPAPADISKESEKKSSDGEQPGKSSAAGAPSKGGQALEVETLKSSLAHAHRMVSNLRSNLHKEKTEKFELKKLLSESQETIEQLQNEMWVDQPTPRRPTTAATGGSGSASTSISGALLTSGAGGTAVQGSGRRRRVRRRTRRPVRFETGGDDDEEGVMGGQANEEEEEEEVWSEESFDESDDGARTPPSFRTQHQQSLSEQLSLADQLRPFTPTKIDQAIQTDDEIAVKDTNTLTAISVSTANNAPLASDREEDTSSQEIGASTLLNDTLKEAHTTTPGSVAPLAGQENVVNVQHKDTASSPEPTYVDAHPKLVVTETGRSDTPPVASQIERALRQATCTTAPSDAAQPLSLADELNISASKLALEQPDEPKGSNAEETTLEKDSAAVSSSDAPTPAALKVPASKDPVPVLITLLQQQSALNNTMPEASKSRSSSDDKLIDLYIPAMLDLLRRYAAGESPGHADKLNDAGTGMTQNTRSEIVPAQDGEKAVPSRSCVIEQVQVVRRESARKAVSAAEGPDELVQPTKPSTNTTLVSMPTITRLESFDTQQNPVNVTSPEKEMEYVDTVAPLETTTHTSSTRVAMAHSAEQTHSAEASSRQSGFADVATTSAPLSDHVGQIPEPEQRQADVRPLAPAIGDSKSEIVSDHNLVYPSCQTSLSGSLSTAVQESSNAAPASTQMISARNPLAADATDHQVDTAISQGHDDEAGVAAASLVPEAEVTTAITTTMTAPTVVPETHPNQVLPSQAVVCAPEVKPTQVIVVAQQQHATRAPSGKGTSWTPSDLASAPAAGSEAGLHQLPESASPSAHKIDEPSLKTMSEPEPVIATEQELSKRADQLDRSENAPPSSVADDSDTCPSPEASAPAPEKVPGESSDQAAVSVAVKRVSRTTVPGPFSSGRASIHLIEEGSSSMALDCGAAKNDSASAAAANDSKAPLTSRVRSTEKADSASLAEHGLNHVAIENGIHDAHIETNDQGPAQTKDEESRTLSQCPLNSSQYKPSSSSSSSASPSKQMTSHSVVPGGSDDVHISPTPAPSLSSPCQVVNSTPSIITTDSRTNIQNKHQHPHCITKEASASNIAGAEAALTARTAAAHTKHDPPSTNKDTAAPVSVQSARALSDSSIPIKDHVSQERDTDVADLSVGGTRQRAGTGTGAGVATATATGAEVVATTSAASPQVTEEDGHTVRLEKGDAKLLTHSEAEAMVAAALEAYRRKSAQGLLPVHTMSGDNHSTSTTTAAAAAASTGREPEQAYGVAYVTSHTHTYHARRESGSSGISTLTERRVTSSLLDTQPVNSAIALITQTMIGNYMWKYTRKAVGQGLSERRHQRFFWIHPYTRTLYWSVDAPGTRGREAKAKSALIENVAVIPTPHPDHLPLSSLLIKTTGRPIKITAPDSATHDVWLEALLYLLERSDNDTALGRIDMAESLSSSAISSLRRPQQLRNVRSTSSFAGSMARRRAAARNFKS